MDLIWLDGQRARLKDSPNVEISFAEQPTPGLIDLVLGMLLHEKYTQEGAIDHEARTMPVSGIHKGTGGS